MHRTAAATLFALVGIVTAAPGIAAADRGSLAGTAGTVGIAAGPSTTAVSPTPWIEQLPPWTLSNDLTVHWGSTPAGTGRTTYDVRERRARWDGEFEPLRVRYAYGEPTSWTFRVYRGYTYCYSARVRDDTGVSPYSSETCTAIPLDDRSLSYVSGWTAGTGAAYWTGTYLRTYGNGATLRRTGVVAKRIALVATTCPTCGTVNVYLGSTLLRTISLYSATTVNRNVISVAKFTSVHTGTVTIKVTSSHKPVIIDGLGIRRTGA